MKVIYFFQMVYNMEKDVSFLSINIIWFLIEKCLKKEINESFHFQNNQVRENYDNDPLIKNGKTRH